MQTCLFSLKCSVSRLYTSYEINFFSVIPQRGNNLAQRYSFVSFYNGGSLGTENESNRIYKGGVVETHFSISSLKLGKSISSLFSSKSQVSGKREGLSCNVLILTFAEVLSVETLQFVLNQFLFSFHRRPKL